MTPAQLKEIRLEMGLTLREMGKALECSHVFVDSMERAVRPIPKEMINKLKIFLKKKMKYIKLVIDTM